jgi:zinc transporter ZupT
MAKVLEDEHHDNVGKKPDGEVVTVENELDGDNKSNFDQLEERSRESFGNFVGWGDDDKGKNNKQDDKAVVDSELVDETNRDTNQKLQKMGLNTALAIGLHNFPEGLATFVAALEDPAVGVVLAVAIAIHNIPEGKEIGRRESVS